MLMTKRLALATLALSFALAGCREMLTETPKNFITTDAYYRTPADIEAATLATYQPLGQADVWRRWLLWDTEMASDMTRINPDEPNFGTYHPGLLLWTPMDGSMTSPWNGLYTSIYRSNLVLENAPKVTFIDTKYQKQLIAEAKFVRAYDYLMLTKAYDDVPLLLTLDDHANTASKSRTPVEQIHQQLIKDLTEAEADLPDAPTQLGRASKAAAEILLADLYQWRSSFLKKPEWQETSTWAKKVIDNPRWGLTDDYLAQYLPANKGNKEVIFMNVSSGLDGRSSTDPNCNWLPRELGFNQAGGCEVVGQPTRWQYESYLCSTPDPLTFNASGRIADTTRIKTCDYRKQVTYRLGGCSTSASIGCIVFKWPNLNKFRPTNRGVGGPSDVDFPLYRYAEALLIYAEAQNELGNPAVAVGVLNQLRARARKGSGTALPEPHAYGTQPGEAIDVASVRSAVFQERNWELAHEGKRWFDQIRRNSLEPGYWKSTLVQHDPETATRGDVSEFRMRFPIPGPERTLNPNLTQNPGY
ncbi:MAG: RagB/SusD family nutrient uptake outer membrane protein [Gemmatimonadaceae bacterium]|nr:RagB/SusD family nutrient uptake outer membrane protein [Gemmatimonadaceae bacterium]